MKECREEYKMSLSIFNDCEVRTVASEKLNFSASVTDSSRNINGQILKNMQ